MLGFHKLRRATIISRAGYYCSVTFTPLYELGNLSSSTCLEDTITRTCTRLVRVLIYPANMILL